MQRSLENTDNPSAGSDIVILDMYRRLADDTCVCLGWKCFNAQISIIVTYDQQQQQLI